MERIRQEQDPRVAVYIGDRIASFDMSDDYFTLELPPMCAVVPDSIDFGMVACYKDTAFTILNTGIFEMSDVVHSCSYFSIISDSEYVLAPDESLVVTIRFEPPDESFYSCLIETGFGDCTDVFVEGSGGPQPRIISVDDVGKDQGNQVRVQWLASHRDIPFSSTPVVSYSILRRVEQFMAGSSIVPESDRSISAYDWDIIATLPACGDEQYSIVVPTLCDSTASGICWSVFHVRTQTEVPAVYFTSPSDSGYSIDNIAPGVPHGFLVVYNTGGGNELSWDPNDDPDLQYYRVYRGNDRDFLPSSGNLLLQTIETEWRDPEYDGYGVYYKITAVDYAGNESDVASPSGTVNDDVPAIPKRFALHQNVPNPFNPSTEIRFDLPRAVHVSICVYNVKGELVSTVINGYMTEGHKEINWTSNDDRGNAISSGIYFYRIVAGDFVQTRKMVLLK